MAHLVKVFREVRRVLRGDGTCWVNLGDSYAGSGKGQLASGEHASKHGEKQHTNKGTLIGGLPVKYDSDGLKPKDMVGIPWRVAFALQADGWWLRSDIIWAKPNCMPESVRDRPTASHEYLFLLAKNRRYFYDQDAVREPQTGGAHSRGKGVTRKDDITDIGSVRANRSFHLATSGSVVVPGGRNRRTVWTIPTSPYSGAHFSTFPPALVEPCIKAGTSERGVCPECGAAWERVVDKGLTAHDGITECSFPKNSTANRLALLRQAARERGGEYVNRSQTIGWRPTCSCGCPKDTEPDDFELIQTPTGERVGNDPSMVTGRAGYNRPRGPNEGHRDITRYEQRHYAKQLRTSPHRKKMEQEAGTAFEHYIRVDKSGARPIPPRLLEKWIGNGRLARVEVPTWAPPEPIPATVLDPFVGSGTTLLVARALSRHGVGLDLSYDYLHDQATKRLELDALARWQGRGEREVAGETLEGLPLFALAVNDH